jgi:hypothetical protein
VVFLVATAQLSVANLVKTPILHETWRLVTKRASKFTSSILILSSILCLDLPIIFSLYITLWGEVSMREYLPPHQLFGYCLNALDEGWCTNTVESVARLESTCLSLLWMPRELWLCPTRDSVVSRVSDVVGRVQRCQMLMEPVAP